MERERGYEALTEAEVARRLGLSAAVLRAWRSRGVGPRFCRFGRSVRYLRDDVERFVRGSGVSVRDGAGNDEQGAPR
jgi:Helix-turn-helix domain